MTIVHTEVATFRSKPVILEGIFFAESTTEDVVAWATANGAVAEAFDKVDELRADNGEISQRGHAPYILIQTPQGEIAVGHGDWLLKDEDNEFYGVAEQDVNVLFERIDPAEVIKP